MYNLLLSTCSALWNKNITKTSSYYKKKLLITNKMLPTLTFPPMRTCACSLANFSWFIIVSFICKTKHWCVYMVQRFSNYLSTGSALTIKYVPLNPLSPGLFYFIFYETLNCSAFSTPAHITTTTYTS